MRVLFLTHSFPHHGGDGPGSSLLLLARALSAEGVEVGVVAPSAQGLAASESLDDVLVHRFHYAPRRFETLADDGNFSQQVRASWGARFTMLGFLGAEFRCALQQRNEFEPDLVHAHWWFPSGLVGTWLSRLSNRPLVTTLHGQDVRLARGVAFSRPGFRHVLRSSAATTAVSNRLAAAASAVVAVPSVQVAPMPVAIDLFTPGGVRSADRLLFVGELGAQSGLDELLQAIAAMRLPASLDVVGEGEEREALRATAGALGLTDRVRWHGRVSQPRLLEFYRSATALVVPSVHEGLGLVAVEAQLCETPVVAFDAGGLRDVVQDGRTGILVPPGEPTALARALDELLGQPDRGTSLGSAGRMHALATFAPESVARRYADIYRNAIASSPK